MDPEGRFQGRAGAGLRAFRLVSWLWRAMCLSFLPPSLFQSLQARGDGPMVGSRRPWIEYQWLSP